MQEGYERSTVKCRILKAGDFNQNLSMVAEICSVIARLVVHVTNIPLQGELSDVYEGNITYTSSSTWEEIDPPTEYHYVNLVCLYEPVYDVEMAEFDLEV